MDHDAGGGHHSYDHHGSGPSFGDLLFGIEVGSGLTGHHVSLADAEALAIFAEIALDHGPGFHGYQSGHLYDVPVLQGTSWHAADGYPADSSPGRLLSLPGIARDETTIETLVWPHGECDPQGQIKVLARRAGMIPFRSWDVNIRGFSEIDQTEGRILPCAPFGSPDDPYNLPNGWYRDASGSTHVWREYFRIPPFLPWLPIFGTPDNFESRRTFLIVSAATWKYDQTADYETRAAFSVYSLPYEERGIRTYRKDQIGQCRARAEHIAQGLRNYLHAQPVPASSVQLRRAMGPEMTTPTVSPEQ